MKTRLTNLEERATLWTFVEVPIAEILTEFELSLTAEEAEIGALTEELFEKGTTTGTTEEAFVEVVRATEEVVGLTEMLDLVAMRVAEGTRAEEVLATALQNTNEEDASSISAVVLFPADAKVTHEIKAAKVVTSVLVRTDEVVGLTEVAAGELKRRIEESDASIKTPRRWEERPIELTKSRR